MGDVVALAVDAVQEIALDGLARGEGDAVGEDVEAVVTGLSGSADGQARAVADAMVRTTLETGCHRRAP